MAIVYKHMPTKYLASFLAGDSLLVGTLSEFRKEEKFEKGIGDRLEGVFERRMTGEFDDVHNNEKIRTLLEDDRLIKIGPGAEVKKIIFNNSKSLTTHPDCFVFCTSKSPHATISTDQDPEPRSVVRIWDAEIFGSVILKALHEAGLAKERAWFGPVEYLDMSVDFFTGEIRTPSPMIKHVHFSFQQEVRFAFEPATKRIEPIILKNLQWPTGLVDLCVPFRRSAE